MNHVGTLGRMGAVEAFTVWGVGLTEPGRQKSKGFMTVARDSSAKVDDKSGCVNGRRGRLCQRGRGTWKTRQRGCMVRQLLIVQT